MTDWKINALHEITLICHVLLWKTRGSYNEHTIQAQEQMYLMVVLTRDGLDYGVCPSVHHAPVCCQNT